MKIKHNNYDNYISCSIGAVLSDSGQVVYEWNDGGRVEGPHGELELDPNNTDCDDTMYGRPVFATCKNNCPGGEL